ncbi:hypothetical protein EV1_000829 [Malus domestica]
MARLQRVLTLAATARTLSAASRTAQQHRRVEEEVEELVVVVEESSAELMEAWVRAWRSKVLLGLGLPLGVAVGGS